MISEGGGLSMQRAPAGCTRALHVANDPFAVDPDRSGQQHEWLIITSMEI